MTAFTSRLIRHRHYAVRLAIVCAAYCGTAKMGLALAFDNASVTAIWPPTGIALAATLIWGYRIWPGIAAGAVLANTWTGVPPATVLGITCGNTLEAMAGAYLLHRADFRISLARVRDVFALFALAGLLSTIVSATIGVASLYAGGHVLVEDIGSTWRTWWLGDMGGDLLIAPLLLVAASSSLNLRELASRRFEVACLLAALVGTSLAVFAIDMPIKYMLFPPMLWAALRFRQVGAVVSSFAVISIGVIFTAAGAGPFTQGSIDGALLLTQTFIGVAAFTCLLLAAISSEQKRAEDELRKAHEGLEETVRERTEELERSNMELALQGEIAANMAEGVMVVSPQGTIAYANPTFETMFGYGPGELDHRPVSVLNAANGSTPEDAAAEILWKLEHEGMFSGEILNVKKDGTSFWTHAEVSTFHHRDIGGKVWVSVQRDITEQKLGQEADARLRAIVGHAGDAILGTTLDGIVTSWNPGSERLYGYTAEEMMGRSIGIIIPDHRPHDMEKVLSSARRGEPFRVEAERQRRDGSLVWVSITVSPVKDRNGAVVGCAGIHSDVTERRQAVEDLAKRESQLADAQRVAHIGSWEWDIGSNAISWSDELYRIHGFEQDEFDGSFEAFMECIHPDDRELVERIVKKAFRDGKPFEYYHRCVRPNGEVRTLHAHGRVELGGDNRPLRMFGTCQDVTQLKRMEEPVRHLAAIVESSQEAIFSKSRKGMITSWNPGAVRLFGYDAEEIIGRPNSVLVPEGRRDEEQEIMENVLAGIGILNYETQRQRKDGTLVDVSVTVSPIKDSDGTVIGCSSITRDITERKRIQEEADRLKDEFFATVSHELRTPLTSIIGYTDLLLAGDAGKLTEQQRRFLEITARNAKRQLRLVGDMLFVSKAEAGEFKIELGRADIEAVASDCVEAARPAAEQRGIELTYSGTRTPGCDADSDRIAQLADNLISNAIKFTPEGGQVRVDLSLDHGQIVLEVANTGSYILPQDRERLFDRFYRSSSACEEAVQGVGLGLTIAEAIVRAHGGTIEVDSEVQTGTVFRARMPIHEPLDANSLSLPERNGSASIAARA